MSNPVWAITGGTGLVGRRLAQYLVSRGYRPRLLVRHPDRLEAALWSSCEVVIGDLADPLPVAKFVADAEYIFHCAANVSTWGAWDTYYLTNVLGVENLFKALIGQDNKPQRFVHLSSMDVYGFPAHPCPEHAPLNGAGFPYGESKILGEALVRQYGKSFNIPYTILRPGNVIGPGSPFIERIGKELRSGVMLTVDGGHAHGGFLFVDNLVEVMLWAARSLGARDQVYNVRDPYDVDWREFTASLKVGIHGKGMVIDMPFWLAEGNARIWEWCYRNWRARKEPLIHPLLVRFFGRTCGHCISKLLRDYEGPEFIGFEQAMERSIAWLARQP